MAKTATEKLKSKKEKKKVRMEHDFAGIKAGQLMLVATPQMVDDYIRKIPYGETRTVVRLRNELARRNRCDASCPVSTAIFVRISAEAAIEAMEQGADVDDVTPFWRVIAPDDKVAGKLNVGSDWIRHQRESER
ncbi:MAG: hypothetical protein AAFX10_05330 [Pseudomonadota bacterium]